MEVTIEHSWKVALEDEFEKKYFKDLSSKVREAYLIGQVFPPPKLIFNAFLLCPFHSVKVVLIGQDPYHGMEQARGLSFSVQDGIRTPPSLQNIYKEIKNDLDISISESGNLEHWANQGILLLNATLTVEKGNPNSHQKYGWETFTDAVIQKISDERQHVVFLLWGKFAQGKQSLIDTTKHLVLTAPHPSPFSAHTGFLGCKHFSKTNAYLQQHAQIPIQW